jgi:putative DNA primase/helicase
MVAEVTNIDEVRRQLDCREAMTGRRMIEWRPGELPRLVAEGEAALIAESAGIYQRGGQLVRVARLDRDAIVQGVNRVAGSAMITAVSREYLTLTLARCADWLKFDGRAKQLRPIDPPAAVAGALLSAVGEWRVPILTGLITAPTLRANGTLLDQPGYDATTGLYGAFDPADFPLINPRPSENEAHAALRLLMDLFCDCAFAGQTPDCEKVSAHAAVAVAALITAAVRTALPTAPAFGISAAKQGSGKTTVAKAIARVVTGTDPPVLTLSDDEGEFKKCLLAILIAGDAVVLVDNIARPVDSASLCAVLTSSTYSERLLGVNVRMTLPSTATWLLTGNHLEFVGDLTSRMLLSVLDPVCEQPEARAFTRDIGDYVREQRGPLLTAALTIALAYAQAPANPDRPSRFREWDQLVRRPLLWLGCADPLDTQAALRGADPVREGLLGVLHAWQAIFGAYPGSVAEALKEAARCGQSERPELHEAFAAVAGERDGSVNAKRLGRYLARNVLRIEDGRRLIAAGDDPATHNKRFVVVEVKS